MTLARMPRKIRRAAVAVSACAIPLVVICVKIHPGVLAGCGTYGYSCVEDVCLSLEVTRTQGQSWESGSAWIYGAPGAEIYVHVRTRLRTNLLDADAWSYGVEHDASELTSAGGEFELWSVAVGDDLESVQNGAAPDFEVTKAWDCGYSQAIVVDMDSTGHKSDPATHGDFVPALACYRLKFSSYTGYVQNISLSFGDNVGAIPKVRTVVSRAGQSIDPCRDGLTLHVQSTTSYPTPSYCPYGQTQSAPCGGGSMMGGGAGAGGEIFFVRGDYNSDADLNITDSIAALSWLFLGGAASPCDKAADMNDDSGVDIADAVYLLGFLFLGTSAPPAPYPACGQDPTADALLCTTFPPCNREGPNVSQLPLPQTETAISINPTDPQNVAVASNHQGQHGLFRGASFDGGQNWSAGSRVLDAGVHTANIDPTLAFDEFGNLYLAYMAVRTNNTSPLHVAISVDGGVTFPPSLVVQIVDFCIDPPAAVNVDRPTIATGPSASGRQSVWITAKQGPRIIAVGAEVNSLLDPEGPPPVFTLHEVEVCNCNFGDIAVGPRGEVLVTYQEALNPVVAPCPSNILLGFRDSAHPSDRTVGFSPPTQMPIGTTNLCGSIKGGQSFAGGDTVWANPYLQWDRLANRAYITYKREPVDTPNVSNAPVDSDTFLRIGIGPNFAIWSEPVVVADTAGTQVLHEISVDPISGELAVGWYGSTSPGNLDDPFGPTLRYFTTYSVGGVGAFKPHFLLSSCDSGGTFIGNDYTAIAFRNEVIFPSWADNCFDPDNTYEVLVERLEVEDCTDGIDNDKDGDTDCADSVCCGHPACPPCELCANRIDDDRDGDVDCADADCVCSEVCGNGVDDDSDGFTDCDDPECCGVGPCVECEQVCDDGIDDDADGLTDCRDSDCDAVCKENCSDSVDNDGDGAIDCEDSDCEPYCAEDCGDALDNDGDGLVDCADPECPGLCFEICDDRVDNDTDGLIDAADPDCGGENCANGVDDDVDGKVDCEDTECCGRGGCPPCPNPRENCANGVDDDGDELVDCFDPDCSAVPVCQELCGDGIDNDRDGLVDCEDVDCCGELACCGLPECPTCENCANGDDDDGDGDIDCEDSDCAEICSCDDGIDNDSDGLIDCEDPDCVGRLPCREDCTDPPGGDDDGDCLDDCADPDCVGTVAEVCADGVDNDADGDVDCFDDDCAGCSSCPEACNNGIDDDLDSLIDSEDPDCERYVAEHCSDGIDNDHDGDTDCDDIECFRSHVCPERCADWIDNDSDGNVDCSDTECEGDASCNEICGDGIDNDSDGGVDCMDSECATDPDCGEICGDNVNNDADADIDCEDSECVGHPACQ